MGRQQMQQQAARTPAPKQQQQLAKQQPDVPVETATTLAPQGDTSGAGAAGGGEAPLMSPERKNQLVNAMVGAGVLAAPVAAYQAFKPQQQQQRY
jgi:hypothetical protein